MPVNYNPTETISAAIAALNLKPVTPVVPVYHTGRSGLPVVVSPAYHDNKWNLPTVSVKIDGAVDTHDADQLAEFFDKLSEALAISCLRL